MKKISFFSILILFVFGIGYYICTNPPAPKGMYWLKVKNNYIEAGDLFYGNIHVAAYLDKEVWCQVTNHYTKYKFNIQAKWLARQCGQKYLKNLAK